MSRAFTLGKLGNELTLAQGYEAARLTGLSILASLNAELGDLDRIQARVKALGLVICAPGFNINPAVIQRFQRLDPGAVGRSRAPRLIGDWRRRAAVRSE